MLKFLFPLREYVSFFNIFQYITFRAAYAAITALLISFLFGPWIIARLRALKTGWTAREDTPSIHQAKAGTPTMGGVLIILSMGVSLILWQDPTSVHTWLLLFATLGFGAIGFTDDLLKMSPRKKGISAGVKFGGQILVSTVIVLVLYIQRTDTTTLLEVMTSPVETCRPQDDLKECVGMMKISRMRHLCVVDGDQPVGIISIRDLMYA